MTRVPTAVSLEELEQLVATVDELDGWDFSRVRMDREPAAWDYSAVARRFLWPGAAVLDVGTGGGERFLELADAFGTGVGVDLDPARVAVARANLSDRLRGRIAFEAMDSRELDFDDERFDVVLSCHARYSPEQVLRVLRPGGRFVAERVGDHMNQPIFDAFGWGSNGWSRRGRRFLVGDPESQVPAIEEFRRLGCRIVAHGESDVPVWFGDIESLVFYLKAIPLPEPFDPRTHLSPFNRYLARAAGSCGYLTNDNSELLVVEKPA